MTPPSSEADDSPWGGEKGSMVSFQQVIQGESYKSRSKSDCGDGLQLGCYCRGPGSAAPGEEQAGSTPLLSAS